MPPPARSTGFVSALRPAEWKNGSAARLRLRGPIVNSLWMFSNWAGSEACVQMAAFGLPVVPLV